MTEIDEKEILSRLEAVAQLKPDPARAAARIDHIRRTLTARPPTDIPPTPSIFQTIAGSRALRFAAAAVVLAGVSLSVYLTRPGKTTPITCFTLLSRACAAEQAIFAGENIVHIVNTITVHPPTAQSPLAERLDQLNLTRGQRRYLQTVNSWLDFNWMPIYSLAADGQFRFHELKLSPGADQPYVITDQAWYDAPTGRFIRLLETAGKIIFANSYDGRSVYFSEPHPDGSVHLLSERITSDFITPQNPARFLGITAGLQSFVEQDDYPPITEVTEGTLEDGLPLRIYKQGFPDLLGDINTYWLFKVRADNGTIAEMEFVQAGAPRLVIRRQSARSVTSAPYSWDLADVRMQTADANSPAADVTPDMWIPDVSLRHMVETAGFDTYIFASTPSWLEEPVISDMADFASPGRRMFCITCQANDGRHIVMYQSQTFNKFFASIIKHARLLYTSANGFKLYGGGPEKWWTEIHLRAGGFTPAEDRTGYALQSPAGTFPSLAVNGRLTNKELETLVDSLVPAAEILDPSPQDLQQRIENLPPGKWQDGNNDPNN